MLKFSLLQHRWLNIMLTPLTVGVVWTIVGDSAVEARPIQSSRCSSVIYGSPIPAPVPVNPVTGRPCSFSSGGSSYRNYRDRDDYRYKEPIRGTIRDSTLINPTIIDSTISDSVLVDPVIIDTPRSTRRRVRSGRVRIRGSEVIDRSSGIRIRVR
ncbi:hypothetical protein MC7420_439 [Coleofasciculus chthonoplastes PCC 7420]|uniref:Uncharacterized protein n=1 Tax=Coleofasciculus chthonoplastes PCC 7420 TaxID=118168 RepID=B4VLY3_9CYAN|nr:hypothetical protein [Coleofasciculus chthonoplastes]EDX77302.1 hypothetical protein MC7420_439 [Coleofasciculus chthonoplastes PCC 7420]